jgi:hypothetical protein
VSAWRHCVGCCFKIKTSSGDETRFSLTADAAIARTSIWFTQLYQEAGLDSTRKKLTRKSSFACFPGRDEYHATLDTGAKNLDIFKLLESFTCFKFLHTMTYLRYDVMSIDEEGWTPHSKLPHNSLTINP